MKQRFKSVKKRKRRRSLRASRWCPYIILGSAVAGILAFIALILFVALPYFLPLIGIEYRAPFSPDPTPAPTVKPSPTPHPIASFDPESGQTEIVLSGENEYRWIADPYFYNDTMLFTGGKLVDNKLIMEALLQYDVTAGSVTRLPYKPEYTHILFPAFNERWLVYLDGKADGGGAIMVVDREQDDAKPKKLKDVYVGQPVLLLDGDYLCWMERTGTRMDKLFVCDLSTFESTALQMFNNSEYGTSLPHIVNGVIIWADADYNTSGKGEATSAINYITVADSKIYSYSPGTYVHDPKRCGNQFIWMDGLHGPQTSLYYSTSGGEPVKVESGVVDFGVGSDFIIYSKNETIWAYMFETRERYRITPERERVQLLGVSGDCVMWMDVTSRERDILKFTTIP